MDKLKLTGKTIVFLVLSIVGTLLILWIPNFFSAEYFAQVFYPQGGIVHSMIGAFLVSLLLAAAHLFSKTNTFRFLMGLVFSISILVNVYYDLRFVYHSLGSIYFGSDGLISTFTSIITATINSVGFIIINLFTLGDYIIILAIPLLIIHVLRKFFFRNLEVRG